MNETQTSRRGRLFYGWVIVLCCMLLSAASGILSGVLSTFLSPFPKRSASPARRFR